MVGRKVDLSYQRKGTISEEVFLKVQNLSTADKLSDISFDLYKGEILGFFGLMGAGRTELAKAIFGYDKIKTPV